jgi:caffeoyl-CoA O-methyltransferase
MLRSPLGNISKTLFFIKEHPMILPDVIEDYVQQYSQPIPDFFEALAQETIHRGTMHRMLCGPSVGRFLKWMVSLSQAQNILEIGTFTGYSTLWMLEGLTTIKGKITTCDVDKSSVAIGQKYANAHPRGHQIEFVLGPALKTLASFKDPLCFAFIDADKGNYTAYYEAILPLLKPGGIIVIDNCLWSGDVLNPMTEEAFSIHRLNERIASDTRVESMFLTIRDGLQVLRKL